MRIFLPERNGNRECRRLHNGELHNLYHSPNILRVNKSIRLRLVDHVARMEKRSSAFTISTTRTTAKKSSGEPRQR